MRLSSACGKGFPQEEQSSPEIVVLLFSQTAVGLLKGAGSRKTIIRPDVVLGELGMKW